jgi:hypothetical protein
MKTTSYESHVTLHSLRAATMPAVFTYVPNLLVVNRDFYRENVFN